ncbi:Calx-beta domain-containing protein [Bacterioplanoides sp.]|uniref:Calx-beta domain-containing protein n=1 Tax=Bacterioplanoides sp. TaxID=2066072 RepID=UPI003B00AB69
MSLRNKSVRFLLVFLTALITACGGSSGSGGATNDPSIIGSSNGEITEGNDKSQNLSLPFTAPITGTILYQTYDLSAVEKSDFVPLSGELQVVSGQQYAILVEVLGDAQVEGNEQLGVLLSDTNNQQLLRLTGTIINDDFPDFQINDTEITEIDSGRSSMQFNVTLAESTIDDYTLSIATLEETGIGFAKADEDYIPVNQSLTFSRNQLNKTISVEVIGDSLIEPNETLKISVSHTSGKQTEAIGLIRTDDTPGSDEAPLFIVNNGDAKTLAEANNSNVSSPDASPDSGVTRYVLPFSIDPLYQGTFTQPFQLSYSLRMAADNRVTDTISLANLNDFNSTPFNVQIVPGTLEYQATIEIIDDRELEGTEVLEFVLQNDQGAEFGTATLFIRDNESPSFKINSDLAINEDTNPSPGNPDSTPINRLVFWEGNNNSDTDSHRLLLSYAQGTTGEDTEYAYTLSYKDSASADDFSTILSTSSKIITSGRVNISSNSDTEITLPILPDTNVEGNEIFFLQMYDKFDNELYNEDGEPIIFEIVIANDDLPTITWLEQGASSSFTPLNNIDLAENSGTKTLFLGFADIDESTLQDFNVSVIPSDTNTPGCSWATTSNLTTNEYSLSHNNRFEQAQQRLAINLSFTDDSFVECDESVRLTANLTSQYGEIPNNNTNNNSAGQATLDLKLINDDNARVTVAGFNTSEDGDHQFDLNLNAPINANLRYKLVHAGTSDADFDNSTPAPITNDGSSDWTIINLTSINNTPPSAAIALPVLDDALTELHENIELQIQFTDVPDNFPISLCHQGINCDDTPTGDSTLKATGTIRNNDRFMINLAANVLLTDDQSTIKGLESELASKPILNFVTQGALAADFPQVTVSAAVTCPDNEDTNNCNDVRSLSQPVWQSGNLTAQLPVFNNDELIEPDENGELKLTLSLGDLFNGNTSDFIGGILSGGTHGILYTIENDDTLKPEIVLNRTESDDNQESTATLTLTLDKAIASNVTDFKLKIEDSCNNCGNNKGQDYSFPTSGQAIDLSGVTANQDITLTIRQDNVIEPNEEITLTLSALDEASGRYLSNTISDTSDIQSLKYTIRNNDFLNPSLAFTNGNRSAEDTGEGNGNTNAQLALNIGGQIGDNLNSSGLSFTLTADCDTCGSNKNSDFTSGLTLNNDNRLAIPLNSNTTNSTYNLTIINDNIIEPDEVVTYTLSYTGDPGFLEQSKRNNLANIGNTTFTIVNNDTLEPEIYFTDTDNQRITAASESANRQQLVVDPGKPVGSNITDLSLNIAASCDMRSQKCAKISDDYTTDIASSWNLTGTSGAARSFNINIKAEALVEPNEAIAYTLSSPSDASYFADSADRTRLSAATYTINNDDTLQPTISFASASGSEAEITLPNGNKSPATAQLTLNLGGEVADNVDDLKVKITSDCSGCTTNGITDYTDTIPAIIDLAGRSTLAPYIITINDDDWVEPNEEVVYTLALTDDSEENYLTNRSLSDTANYTINNDDFLTPAITLNNNRSNDDVEVASSVTLQLDKNIANNATDLKLSLTDNCNDCGTKEDYSFPAAQAIDLAGITTDQTFTLTITQDNRVEPDEIITFTLSAFDDASAAYLSNTITDTSNIGSQLTYTIENNDFLNPALSFNRTEANEGADSTSNTATLTLDLNAEIGDNIDDQITLSLTADCVDCGNNKGTDFASGLTDTNASITLKSTTTIDPYTLTVRGDDIVEPNEQITYTLAYSGDDKFLVSSKRADKSQVASADFTITNDDTISPSLSFINDKGAENSSGIATLKLTLGGTVADNAKDLALQIKGTCTNCGNNKANDYNDSAVKSSVPLAGESGSDEFKITITEDSIIEPNEVLSYTLSSTSDASYFADSADRDDLSSADYTIENDDFLDPTLSLAKNAGNEGADNADTTTALTLNMGGQLGDNLNKLSLGLSLTATCSGCGNNIAGDFTSGLGSTNQSQITLTNLTNSAPDSTTPYTLTVHGDNTVEPDEVITYALTYTGAQDYLKDSKRNPLLNSVVIDSQSYTITNDDVIDNLELKLSATSRAETAAASATMELTSTNDIAENIKDLTFTVSERCEAYIGDTSISDKGCGDNNTTRNAATVYSYSQLTAPVLLEIENDPVVEPDETITYTLAAASDSDGYLKPGIAFTEQTYEIQDDDQTTITLGFKASGFKTSESEEEADKELDVILTSSRAIASNVQDLSFTLSANCPGCFTNNQSDFDDGISGSGLFPVSGLSLPDSGDAEKNLVKLKIENDNLVEPDETITYTLAVNKNNGYLANPANKTATYTIVNNDQLDITVTSSAASISEGNDMSYNLSWDKSLAANNLSAVYFHQTTTDINDDLLNETGVTATAVTLSSNDDVDLPAITARDDQVIELDEAYISTFSALLGSTDSSEVANFINLDNNSDNKADRTLTIQNDDFFDVTLPNSIVEGDKLTVKLSVPNGYTYQFDGDSDLEFEAIASFDVCENQSISDCYLADNEKATATDFVSSETSKFQVIAKSTSLTSDITFEFNTQENTIQSPNKWFNLEIIDDASGYRLPVSVRGKQAIVIINDEVQSIVDTGIEECIAKDGDGNYTIDSENCANTTATPEKAINSNQEAELNYPIAHYTFVDVNGVPIPRQADSDNNPQAPDNYRCVQDNYTGYLWLTDNSNDTDTSSAPSTLPSTSDPAAAVLTDYNNECGQTGWGVPTLHQLFSVLDFSKLNSQSEIFRGSETEFWTKSVCGTRDDIDSNQSFTSYWVLNILNGTTSCKEQGENHSILPIYQ